MSLPPPIRDRSQYLYSRRLVGINHTIYDIQCPVVAAARLTRLGVDVARTLNRLHPS